jgi:hypothetical protein
MKLKHVYYELVKILHQIFCDWEKLLGLLKSLDVMVFAQLGDSFNNLSHKDYTEISLVAGQLEIFVKIMYLLYEGITSNDNSGDLR